MAQELIMPQMGESMVEGTIVAIHVKKGDTVKKDQVLLEIATDKIDTEVPAPNDGVISEVLCKIDEVLKVGAPLIRFEIAGKGSEKAPGKTSEKVSEKSSEKASDKKSPESKSAPSTDSKKVVEEEEEGTWDAAAVKNAPQRTFGLAGQVIPATSSPKAEPSPSPSTPKGEKPGYLSPFVKKTMKEQGVTPEEVSTIQGNGQGGRVQKEDLLGYIQNKEKGEKRISPPTQMENQTSPLSSSSPYLQPEWLANTEEVEVVKLDNIRQKMAKHMVHSVQTSPHVTTVVKVDMENIARFREKNKKTFEAQEGCKLTYMPFIAQATVKALKAFPWVNASIVEQSIHLHKGVHLGVAVAMGKNEGLIVPVVKNAQDLSLSGLAKGIDDIAGRARTKKLKIEDLQGGTFTLTNFGSFGSLFGTPIINQPQVAILGIGATLKEPVVINDMIAIRHTMYLSLSFDHRIIDGAMGGQFLQFMQGELENWSGGL